MTITLFEEYLKEAGCQLDNNGKTAHFTVEPILFRRQLNLKLRSSAGSADAFFDSIQTYTEDSQFLRQCLLPTDAPQSSRALTCESVFKTLLAIDVIQPKIMVYLLERLPEFQDELENDHSSSCTARLILHQLRWLDFIVEPQILTEKLIEIIQIMPPIIQHEIITSLPDIINDSEHKPMVVYLKELMHENGDLTVPILDALSNLTLHSESLDDVRQTVLERLESAELDDLAVIVKFLLQTATPHTIDEVIYGIRHNLDFYSLGKLKQNEFQSLTSTTTIRSRKSDANAQAPEALILESIKLGLQFHKFVCDSWIKSITALEDPGAHKIIDVLVLFILHSMTSMKKKAEQIFRKKIINRAITAQLIQLTLTNHGDALTGYWNTILSLSDSVLRSSRQNHAIVPCSSTLYVHSFIASNAHYQLEIIGSLVTHIGSGETVEIDVALNVLLQLVKFDVERVSEYAVFIKGILDYLDNLSLGQIRVLFDIFSIMALTTEHPYEGGSANLWSDIQIVIRKQLSNPREKYKKIGIIGCLSAVKVLGSAELCNRDSNTGSSTQGGSSTQTDAATYSADNALRHPYLKQAVYLLEMLLHNCSEYPVCLALVYDELAHIFENTNLDQRLQLWIKESWMVDFTDQYVSDMDELNELVTVMARKQNVFLKPGLWMNLDGEDAQIAMKMYELVLMDDEKKRRSLVVPLCSIFKLIQSCEKKLNNGGLEEIDALLGCGIILFNQETEEEMIRSLDPRELENVCDLLFYTINWFRELLNAFSTLSDDEVHQKLCLRLKNILALETMLQSFITYVPHYLPLEMHSSLSFKESKEMTGVSFPKADPRSSTQVDADASDGEEGTPRPSTKKDTSIRSSTGRLPKLAELKRHMRAFNISVLSLLQVNDAGDANGDAENKLDYACINYLLSDLNEKLDIKVVPAPVHFFGKKKMTNNKKHSVYNALLLARMDAPAFIKQIIQYVPFMLQRLEMLYEDLQLQEVYSGRINQKSEALAHCVAYIFDILLKMLSWPEIENPENRDVLHALVNAIAERIMMESVHQPSFQKIVVEAFQYLCRFGENMPQAQTAVVLFKLLERLRELSGDIVELSSGGHKVVQGILSTDWFDWRNIKKDIPFLIERSIALSDDPAAVLYNYTTEILPEFERQGGFEQYPLLRTETLVDYYQAIINQTIHLLRTLHENPVDPELMLTQNARIVTVFERTIHCIKTKEERSLFGVLLRTARSFIDEFSKHSIPFFTSIFKTYREPIVGIFKDFQTSTRMLQVICSHVKALKDSQLSSYVPMLKKALETVIFQVKMLLTENNAPADAFFLGALKHRDIRGAEISSQLPREETSESEIEEDQLAEEDSSATTPAESRPSKPAPAKRRKRPTKESPNLPDIRTTSQVPSSSDEDEQDGFPVMPDDILDDDKEEEVEMIRAAKRPIEIIEDDDDEEEVIEFDLDDENDEEAEKEASPAPVSSVESASRNTSKVVPSNPIKRPRLGLGRPNQRSNRVFNLSRRPSSNSDDE